LTRRRGSHLPIAAEVIEGRPADVLAAAGSAADLLVLGSHGHSRVRHTVLGSVSEDCIRKASCPVVVIPVPVERSERAPVEFCFAHEDPPRSPPRQWCRRLLCDTAWTWTMPSRT
jgi:hypothetical protein